LSAFVATLGTMTIFSGMAFQSSNGATIFRGIEESFVAFGQGNIGPLPSTTVIMIVTLIITWIVLEQTVYGRRLYSIGGNPEASRLSGVRVRPLRLSAFVISGLGAAVAGLVLTSRLSSANPTQGDGLMLNAIASVFLGMTMSIEGEPHIFGTLIGVLILGVLANGLTLLGMNTYLQQMMTGAIIILAVLSSSLSKPS
jgi:ribose transport system permease protein